VEPLAELEEAARLEEVGEGGGGDEAEDKLALRVVVLLKAERLAQRDDLLQSDLLGRYPLSLWGDVPGVEEEREPPHHHPRELPVPAAGFAAIRVNITFPVEHALPDWLFKGGRGYLQARGRSRPPQGKVNLPASLNPAKLLRRHPMRLGEEA